MRTAIKELGLIREAANAASVDVAWDAQLAQVIRHLENEVNERNKQNRERKLLRREAQKNELTGRRQQTTLGFAFDSEIDAPFAGE